MGRSRSRSRSRMSPTLASASSALDPLGARSRHTPAALSFRFALCSKSSHLFAWLNSLIAEKMI